MSLGRDFTPGLSQSTPILTSGRQSPVYVPPIEIDISIENIEGLFKKETPENEIFSKFNELMKKVKFNPFDSDSRYPGFFSANIVLENLEKELTEKARLELVKEVRYTLDKTLALTRGEEIWFGTKNNGFEIKFKLKKENIKLGLFQRVVEACNGKNEKQERAKAESSIDLGRKDHVALELKNAFKKLYEEIKESYIFNCDNNDSSFSMNLSNLFSKEFRLFFSAFKNSRKDENFTPKDEVAGRKINVIDFTQNSEDQTVDVLLKNITPDKKKIDHSLLKGVCKHLGIDFNKVHEEPKESKLLIFEDELRIAFQSSLKSSYPKTYGKIQNGKDLEDFESEFGAKIVYLDISLPIDKLKTDEEKVAFEKDISNFAKFMNNGIDLKSACSSVKLSGFIQLAFDNFQLSSLSPERILKSYKAYEESKAISASPETKQKWTERVSGFNTPSLSLNNSTGIEKSSGVYENLGEMEVPSIAGAASLSSTMEVPSITGAAYLSSTQPINIPRRQSPSIKPLVRGEFDEVTSLVTSRTGRLPSEKVSSVSTDVEVSVLSSNPSKAAQAIQRARSQSDSGHSPSH